MRTIILFLSLFTVMPVQYLFAQQNRVVVRTNAQGQIVRLIVNENRQIVRQQIIGQVGAAAPARQPQQQAQVPQRIRQPQQANPAQVTPPQRAALPAQTMPLEPTPPPAQSYAPDNAIQPDDAIPTQRGQVPAPLQTAPTPNAAYHLVGISLDFLLQNGQGFSRFSTQLNPADINSVYAGNINSWGTGNTRFGLSVGLSYAYVSSKIAAFLMQVQFDSTGWSLISLNFGLGLKIPVHPRFTLAIDSYFCIGFTGAMLPPLAGITVPAGNPPSMMAVIGLFGFKTRIALEFPLPKNTYVAVALSYAAYPWGFSSAKGSFAINNIPLGTAIIADAFKIGIEFGWKLPVKK